MRVAVVWHSHQRALSFGWSLLNHRRRSEAAALPNVHILPLPNLPHLRVHCELDILACFGIALDVQPAERGSIRRCLGVTDLPLSGRQVRPETHEHLRHILWHEPHHLVGPADDCVSGRARYVLERLAVSHIKRKEHTVAASQHTRRECPSCRISWR